MSNLEEPVVFTIVESDACGFAGCPRSEKLLRVNEHPQLEPKTLCLRHVRGYVTRELGREAVTGGGCDA